jgi:hypothetical protein
VPEASPITRAIDEVLRRAVDPAMTAAGWSRKRRSWSKVSERSVRVVSFWGSRVNRGVEGRAQLMAGVSYLSIGEPRPAHLSVPACQHQVERCLHEPGEPDAYVWFTHADDEAQVDQQAQDLAWNWEHLVMPRLELLDDPRELRDWLVAHDLTAEALPLCDLLGDRDWTVGVLRQHLAQARLSSTSADPHGLPPHVAGLVWAYFRGVTWAEQLGVSLSEEDRALARDVVEKIRAAPADEDQDTLERANTIADYLGVARITTNG